MTPVRTACAFQVVTHASCAPGGGDDFSWNSLFSFVLLLNLADIRLIHFVVHLHGIGPIAPVRSPPHCIGLACAKPVNAIKLVLAMRWTRGTAI